MTDDMVERVARARTMKRKKAVPKRKLSHLRKMSSRDLCISLAAIAAFHVEDKQAQMKIYEAMRRLEILRQSGFEW